MCVRRTVFRSGLPSGQGRTANPRRRVKTFWRPGTGRYGVLALPFRRRRRPDPAAARQRHRRRLAAASRPPSARRGEPVRTVENPLGPTVRRVPPPSPTRFQKERGREILISYTALSVITGRVGVRSNGRFSLSEITRGNRYRVACKCVDWIR